MREFDEIVARLRYSRERAFAELDAMIEDGTATEEDFEEAAFNRRRDLWSLRYRCGNEGDLLAEAHSRMANAAQGKDA